MPNLRRAYLSSLRHRQAKTDSDLCFQPKKADFSRYYLTILDLEGHQNCIRFIKTMATLLNAT